ncbi:TPA: lipocalin-like domain-containing protein [Bacillus cereus]|nr:lipocalin-like domain-containing protein [Bacillus cereus]
MSLKKRFIGTWELEDFYMYTQNEACFYPFGKKAKGLIMYTSDDYVSVIITRDNQSLKILQNDSLNELSEEDQQFLKTDSFSYTGSFKVEEEQKVIIHNVQATSLQNVENPQFTRYYKFDGDKLILSTIPVKVGKVNKKPVFLVWKRII